MICQYEDYTICPSPWGSFEVSFPLLRNQLPLSSREEEANKSAQGMTHKSFPLRDVRGNRGTKKQSSP